jgi:hypothetical protein
MIETENRDVFIETKKSTQLYGRSFVNIITTVMLFGGGAIGVLMLTMGVGTIRPMGLIIILNSFFGALVFRELCFIEINLDDINNQLATESQKCRV